MYKQAEKVIRKFGGASRLGKAIGRHRSVVTRWMYSKEKGGTGGLIPSSALDDVMKAAPLFGIELTPEDLIP